MKTWKLERRWRRDSVYAPGAMRRIRALDLFRTICHFQFSLFRTHIPIFNFPFSIFR